MYEPIFEFFDWLMPKVCFDNAHHLRVFPHDGPSAFEHFGLTVDQVVETTQQLL